MLLAPLKNIASKLRVVEVMGKLHSFTWASGHFGASMFHIDPAFQSCLGSVVGVVRMQVGVTIWWRDLSKLKASEEALVKVGAFFWALWFP